ncbi:MAG TPA: DNRLRE domain-containing protein, partial [Candidatus Limnocylindria bacterium]|nr:DNRLRE domain-containing protein [Candidatus Limnocylindria bacterium]
DGAAAGACTSPVNLSGLALGPHTFAVTATDPSDNTDPTPAQASWNVVAPTSATFAPVADTYVDQWHASRNNGSATTLSVDGRTSRQQQALLRFSVTGIPQPVTSATLRIFVSRAVSNGPTLLPTGGTWNEGTVTWDSRPSPTGPAFRDLAAVPTGWVDIDVTSWITGNGTYNLLMQNTVSGALRFASRETSTAPQLVVDWGQ